MNLFAEWVFEPDKMGSATSRCTCTYQPNCGQTFVWALYQHETE